MFLELQRNEELLLAELVEARIRELKCREQASGRDDAEFCECEQLLSLQRLLHRLHETEWEATC
jgi:hypothetical protein